MLAATSIDFSRRRFRSAENINRLNHVHGRSPAAIVAR